MALESREEGPQGAHEALGHAWGGWRALVARGAPVGLLAPPKAFSVSYVPENIVKKFRCIWTSFDMDFLENQKEAENNNWHWALGQYVSP